MPFWTYQNLAAVTNGQWLIEPEDLRAQVTGLWHDTRDIKPGQAYLAIKGDNFDGHAFIDKAFEAGAALAIVQSEPPSLEGGAGGRVPSQPVLKVDDTVVALQDLARAYRDELTSGGCKVIGIAGSNGKTTTRHLIHHVLTHAGLKGIQSPKSFNNHLGVPLTLLSALPGDDFVAAEIGTNHPGEIDFLSAIARPDIAVITSISEEHLEFFKDLEGVAKEESAILHHVVKNGCAVTHDSLREHLGQEPNKNFNRRILTYAGPETTYRIWPFIDQDSEAGLQHFHIIGDLSSSSSIDNTRVIPYEEDAQSHSTKFTLSLEGLHNVDNAVAAVVVARLMNAPIAVIQAAFLTIRPVEGRLQRIYLGCDVEVINDAYNANPSSMIAAINTITGDTQRRRVAVLGDMLELGEHAWASHTEIGEYLARYASRAQPPPETEESRETDVILQDVFGVSHAFSQLGLLILIGPDMEHAYRSVVRTWPRSSVFYYPEWITGLDAEVVSLLEPGDTVLLKASRGMRLERLIPAIERRFGAAKEDEPT